MDKKIWKLILDYLTAKNNAGNNVHEIEQEEEKIGEWLSKDPKHQQELEQALWLWNNTSAVPENEEWKESFNTIQLALFEETPKKTNSFKIWLTAAAVFAATALFIFFYKQQQTILPNTEIAWITKSASSGSIINILLPDSTEIWLNSGSSISFPKNIQSANLRTVRLKGEAFFKVKRDPQHPFVVHSSNIQTRVLGTSFNISAWKGHNTEVTVLTGKVAVSRDSAGRQSVAIHLLPNQKAVYDFNSSKLSMENVEDSRTAIGWTEGKMVFEQIPVNAVFAAIERRYAVKIVADQSFKDCKLTARFNNISLNEVMQTIQMALDIHYTINNKTVYIKGGKCN